MSEQKVKLSEAQQQVLDLMAQGWHLSMPPYIPYATLGNRKILRIGWCLPTNAMQPVDKEDVLNLANHGLIQRSHSLTTALDDFFLTDAGLYLARTEAIRRRFRYYRQVIRELEDQIEQMRDYQEKADQAGLENYNRLQRELDWERSHAGL